MWYFLSAAVHLSVRCCFVVTAAESDGVSSEVCFVYSLYHLMLSNEEHQYSCEQHKVKSIYFPSAGKCSVAARVQLQ
jgi:hypothetical protein